MIVLAGRKEVKVLSTVVTDPDKVKVVIWSGRHDGAGTESVVTLPASVIVCAGSVTVLTRRDRDAPPIIRVEMEETVFPGRVIVVIWPGRQEGPATVMVVS